MLVKKLPRRDNLSHRIRIGDGIVLLISDSGAAFDFGDEIMIRLSNLTSTQIKLSIDAPRHTAPVYVDMNPKTPDVEGS